MFVRLTSCNASDRKLHVTPVAGLRVTCEIAEFTAFSQRRVNLRPLAHSTSQPAPGYRQWPHR